MQETTYKSWVRTSWSVMPVMYSETSGCFTLSVLKVTGRTDHLYIAV